MFKVNNNYRIRKGIMGSDDSYENNGCFNIPHYRIKNYSFYTQVSDGDGWEHVSVSVGENGKKQQRCPTWEEMCWIKDQFWDKDDCIIQYHPVVSEYVNMHPFVLHLWKPINQIIPTPDKIMVGINLK